MIKLCAWCKKSDWGDTEAGGLYRGSRVSQDGVVMPFKAWLCEMHADDGDIIRITLIKSTERHTAADDI